MEKYIKIFTLFFIIILLFSCSNESNRVKNALIKDLKIDIEPISNIDLAYVFIFTDYDCSDCNISFIKSWLNSIKADNNNVTVYLLLFKYNVNSQDSFFNDIKSLFKEDHVFLTKKFDIVKNAAIVANEPTGPFVIKIQENSVQYSKKVSNPFY